MLTAEASVVTERSGRYLVQLCRHLDLAARARPQLRAQVTWSEASGVISFDWGRCTLRAERGVLSLRAEAPDAESLHRLEQRVAGRLTQIGRRDQLTVIWTPPQQGAGNETADARGRDDEKRTPHD